MKGNSNWRVKATIDRLISNIPLACEVLEENGRVNLAFHLHRDRENLVYWQAAGGLVESTESGIEPGRDDSLDCYYPVGGVVLPGKLRREK